MADTVKKEKKPHEPLFHIVKRTGVPWYISWSIRAGAILAALVVCAVVTMALTHLDPLKVYKTMFTGAFGSVSRFWNLLQALAMLLCVSLALTPAFKMKFWNIGGEGQVLIGGLATAACMIVFGGKLPNAALILVMLIASLAAGAVWAVIPAVFKAQWNTNETLFTLMMNYVAIQLVSYYSMVWEARKG
ncbi:MAG: ABC transporter permease, partial [Oscillospiraceae bacterium]|nr:ABC transporter permease [Oscillospiraceae bacterium]